MGEHIPAPWRLQRPPHITWDGPSGAFEICGGEDGSIVICQRPWAEGNPVAIQEHEANAHLIVAAPDLLSACEVALKRLREFEFVGLTSKNTIPMLIAAIVKAKGA